MAVIRLVLYFFKNCGKNREIIGNNISTGLDTMQQQRPKRQNSYQQAMGFQTSKQIDG